MKSIFYEIFLKLGFALVRIALKRTPKFRLSSTDVDFRVRIAKNILEIDPSDNKITLGTSTPATYVNDKFGSNKGVDEI